MINKQLYETVMLALNEIPQHEMTQSEIQDLNILTELLPMYWENSERVKIACELLTGKGRPSVAELAIVNPKEIASLYKATQKAKTQAELNKATQELGWRCLEALTPMWTEELI